MFSNSSVDHQDCNNRTCVYDIASGHYSNLTVLNPESLSETENVNISVISNKTKDSLSDPENTSDYENETVQDVSNEYFDTSTRCDISENINTLPYNNSTISVVHHIVKMIFLP